MSGSLRAVLFDVDGTLVDTNYPHAVTWWQTFAQGGRYVPMADIHRAIGMGAGQLLDRLLPADRDKDADTGLRLSQGALERAGVPAGQAVFVGDTVWDMQASQKAGVPCIALLRRGHQPSGTHRRRRRAGLRRSRRTARSPARQPARAGHRAAGESCVKLAGLGSQGSSSRPHGESAGMADSSFRFDAGISARRLIEGILAEEEHADDTLDPSGSQ